MRDASPVIVDTKKAASWTLELLDRTKRVAIVPHCLQTGLVFGGARPD